MQKSVLSLWMRLPDADLGSVLRIVWSDGNCQTKFVRKDPQTPQTPETHFVDKDSKHLGMYVHVSVKLSATTSVLTLHVA